MKPYRQTLHRTVRVHLNSGESIEGVLVAQRGELLVLGAAKLLRPREASVNLDGEVLIERARILFSQVLAVVPT